MKLWLRALTILVALAVGAGLLAAAGLFVVLTIPAGRPAVTPSPTPYPSNR